MDEGADCFAALVPETPKIHSTPDGGETFPAAWKDVACSVLEREGL